MSIKESIYEICRSSSICKLSTSGIGVFGLYINKDNQSKIFFIISKKAIQHEDINFSLNSLKLIFSDKIIDTIQFSSDWIKEIFIKDEFIKIEINDVGIKFLTDKQISTIRVDYDGDECLKIIYFKNDR